MAVLARNPLAVAIPAMALLTLTLRAERWSDVRFDWRRLALFGTGFAFPFSLLCYYNWERFGSVGEGGFTLFAKGDPAADYGKKPLFGLRYFWHNFTHYLFSWPIRADRFPWIIPNLRGLSMLIATPILWLLPWARWLSPVVVTAVLGIVPVQMVYWLYFTDGVGQWGMRYTVDYLPLVMLLVMTITRERFGRLAIALTVLGIVLEVWAFVTFKVMGW